MSPKTLEGRNAIVTGGARGIGAGIASRLADAGARVALLDLDVDYARATADTLPLDALACRVDASDAEEMREVVAEVVDRLGSLDIMVNNAGGGTGAEPVATSPAPVPPFTNVEPSSWEAQIRNNLTTTYAGARAAIPHLQANGGGAMVNIASIAGLRATPHLPAYGAAKAGVVQLTRTLALELAPADVTVNAICPGLLWTRAWEMLAGFYKATVPEMAELEPREIFLQIVARQVPSGREQTVEDIGDLVTFLASDGARSITGQSISVDGGLTLGGVGSQLLLTCLVAIAVVATILVALLGLRAWRSFPTAAVLCRVPLLIAVALVGLAFLPDGVRNLLALRSFGECLMVGMLLLQAGALVGLVTLLILRYAPARFGLDAELGFSPFDRQARERFVDRWPILRLIAFSVLALPLAAAVVSTTASHDEMAGSLARPALGLLGGAVLGLGILLLIEALWKLDRFPTPLTQAASGFFRILRAPGFLDEKGDVLPGHGLALAMLTVLAALYAILGVLLAPHTSAVQMPALAAVVGLLMLVCSFLAGLSFALDYWRIPILLAILVFAAVVHVLAPFDHRFPAHAGSWRDVAADAVRDPGEAAVSAPGRRWGAPLVESARLRLTRQASRSASDQQLPVVTVVTASGGGIQAAAWTTRVLSGLDSCVGPRFTESIQLMSATSGGAVGTLFFLEAVRGSVSSELDPATLSSRLELAHEASQRSSLGATAWGMAYPDFLRFALPLVVRLDPMRDRAWAMERAWLRHLRLLDVDHDTLAESALVDVPEDHRDQPWLSDWATAAAVGELPGVVFNGTFVEDGEPFLMSNLDLSELPFQSASFDPSGDRHFGATLDLPVVTAARLAATFPFVTPVARARDVGPHFGEGAEERDELAAWHVADGGYYDNFGTVAAALWLEQVRSELGPSRVVLVRIDAFPEAGESPPPEGPPGVLAPTLAPLRAVIAVRNASQILRSDVELDFVRDRLAQVELAEGPEPSPGLGIERIRPLGTDETPPLSWHLSARESAALERAWQRVAEHHCSSLNAAFDGAAP